MPKTADTFYWGGMRFEVVDMDGRRVDKVLVNRIPRRERAYAGQEGLPTSGRD